MQQNTNWMKLLIFGILSSFSIGCRDTSGLEHEGVYLIRNNSGYDIEIISYSKIKNSIDTLELPNGMSQRWFVHGRDSVIVTFDTFRQSTFVDGGAIGESRFNPLHSENYRAIDQTRNRNGSLEITTYEYVFTKEDFNYAEEL